MVETSRPSTEAVVPAGGLGVGAWQLDLRARRVEWSPDLDEIYGIEPGLGPEPTVEALLAFVHPDDRPQAAAVVSETVAARREGYEQRFRIVRPDGEVRHILSRARLLRDANGEPVKLTGVDVDLGGSTARQQSQEDIGAGAGDTASDPLEALWTEIEGRFGVCPSFFKLARNDAPTARMLWQLAQDAYLDFSAPSLFKEQLFTCLSRYCRVRYCVARHAGFLMGLGRPSADATALTLSPEQVLRLLEQPLPEASDLPDVLATVEAESSPIAEWPALDSEIGRRIRIACEAVFLDPVNARPWLSALHRLLGAGRYEQLMLFLAFVRMANFWTELHPEVEFEGDLKLLLDEHRALAAVLQAAPDEAASGVVTRVREEIDALTEQQKLAEQLRLITDALPAQVAYLDGDQRYAFANSAYAAELGSTPQTLIGRTMREVLGKDRYREAWPHLDAALRGQGVQRYEVRLAEGEPLRISQVAFVPHLRADGPVAGCTVLVVDITERKVAEAALRESEAGFRTLAAALPAMVWACRPDGFVFYLNPRWMEYTGQMRDESRGFGWADTIHPDDRSRILAQWERCRRAGDNYEGEIRYRRRDGQYRWHCFRGMPSRSEDGSITAWYGVSLDVQEAKVAEHALRESEARFREMADAAPMMVWVSEATGRATFLSRSWYEFTGHAAGEGLGFGWLDAVHPEDRDDARDAFLVAVQAREPFRLDYRLRRADGEYRWAIDAAAPRLGEGGEFLGYIGSVIDISARKEAEERQTLLMREVDHRARNALAVVQSVVRLTRADNPADFVATVEGRIGAIAYAHTLLAESGWTRASLRSLLERELAAHPPDRVRLSGDDIVLRPESAQPFALTIHELVTNAAKYGALSSASGFLEVSWEHEPAVDGVRILWRESGGPPVEPPARSRFGSTLIATALEQQLGGTVRQDWKPEGLVCELVIPGDRLRGAATTPSRGLQPKSGSARILVVEDDTLIALDVEQMLTRLGYQVIGPVGRLTEALQSIEHETIDAVVLDADLAGKSAAPVARRLRELAIPFVIATGYGQITGFGAVDEIAVLTKPIARQDLQRAVAALLAGRRT